MAGAAPSKADLDRIIAQLAESVGAPVVDQCVSAASAGTETPEYWTLIGGKAPRVDPLMRADERTPPVVSRNSQDSAATMKRAITEYARTTQPSEVGSSGLRCRRRSSAAACPACAMPVR